MHIKLQHLYRQLLVHLMRNSKYSRLSLSRIPRVSLKYFEISVLRHIRFADLRTTAFNKCIFYWTLEVRDMLKILWKKGEIAP